MSNEINILQYEATLSREGENTLGVEKETQIELHGTRLANTFLSKQ
jgi:hypothetical protein